MKEMHLKNNYVVKYKKTDFIRLPLWYSLGELTLFCKNINHPTSLMHMNYVS